MSPTGEGAIGVVFAAASDEIALPVLDTLQEMGYDAFKLTLGAPWPDRRVLQLVVPGPMYALNRLFAQLPESLQEWPVLRVWLTEQTPDPAMSSSRHRAWFYGLDRVRQLEVRLFRALGHKPRWYALLGRLQRAQRLRLASQLRWLYRIGRLRALATMTPSHAEYYRNRVGIPSECIPFGYHASFGHDLRVDRDIDVLFLGSMVDPRRAAIIDQLRTDLAVRGVQLTVIDGSPTGPHVFGEERTLLINRTKLFLNIMRQPWDDLVFRMLLAAPNGAMVLSEPVVDHIPFAPATHFASAPLNTLPDAIVRWLADHSGRELLAATARRRVIDEMGMPSMLARLMAAAA